MLHLIFQSPLETATLARIGENDAVLFLENAVLSLLKQGSYASHLTALQTKNQLFVLIADIETRGISPDELIEGIQIIDYSAWVALTLQQRPIQSWF